MTLKHYRTISCAVTFGVICTYLTAHAFGNGQIGGCRITEGEEKVATIVILHTNDIHGHLTAWSGWEDDLKGKTVGGFDRLAGLSLGSAKTKALQSCCLMPAI